MERFLQLGPDIVKLWQRCGGDYLNGIKNTLILALVATAIGCVIGLICGILNTIPCAKNDPPAKRFFVKLIRGSRIAMRISPKRRPRMEMAA